MHYKAYFILEKQLQKAGFNVDRSELLLSFTDGRTKSLRALSSLEYQQFISWIKVTFDLQPEDWQQSPKNRMRRKIYALFIHHMGYTKERLENWCVKYGKYHKKLNDHNYNELIDLVTQAENTYTSFTKAISR